MGQGSWAQVKAENLARISVRGVVQGVGFRPFVYRLAQGHNLKGWVRNTSGNVEIEEEEDEDSLANFLSDLEDKAPPMARTKHGEATFDSPQGYAAFEIHESLSQKPSGNLGLA